MDPSAHAAGVDTGQWVVIHYLGDPSGIPGLSLESDEFSLYFEKAPKAPSQPAPAASPSVAPKPKDVTAQPSSPQPTQLVDSFWILLSGRFEQKNAKLVVGKESIKTTQAGAFRLKLSIQGEITPLILRSVKASGEVQEQRLELKMERFKEFRASWKGAPPPPKRTTAQVGLSGTLNQYALIGRYEYRQTAITAKASLGYALVPEKWDLGLSAFFTALPLSLKGPTQSSIRYLGVNARAGYRLPFLAEPWRLFLQGGLYFNTMFTSPTEVGYRNIGGPQIFPVLVRAFPRGSQLSAYFKYSPISGGLTKFVSLQSRELAFGGAYRFPKSPLSVTLDYANLNLETDQGLSQNRSFAVGVSAAL